MKNTMFQAIPIDIVQAGRRVQERSRLRLGAVLHSDAAICDGIVTDLTTDGCRLETRCDAAVDSPVTVMISRSTLIGGRVAWRDGDTIGVAFCARLLPRAIAQAMRSGTAVSAA